MSGNKQNAERAIVIHPPLSGEPHAIAHVVRENNVTTVILPDPAELNAKVPSPAAVAIARAAAPTTERASGLDAYRGFFLLLMTFAMTIPHREGLFPQWMYHMQTPPSTDFIARAGLTWRDLLFPGFLFTMCTAIPITNSLRLGKGMPYPAILWTAVKRFALLYLFALIIGHALPYWTRDYTQRGNFVAIAGFLVCWPIFMRKPASWSESRFDIVKKLGWVLGAAFLIALPYVYGAQFDLARKDGIIHALAFVSLVTTTLWLFTRHNPLARLGVLGLVIALTAASDLGGPGADLLQRIEVPWLFQAWMAELLIIGIPATIIGDMLFKWMRQRADEARVSWPLWRLAALSAVSIAAVAAGVVGFYLRQVNATAIVLTALAVIGVALVRGAHSEREKILASLFRWSAVLLVAGALVEPLGGGIKKDPQTLSYLVFTAGAAMAILVALMIATDVLKLAKRATRLLVDVGQNPLLAYVAFTMFFNNIAWLTVFPRWQASNAGQALMVSAVFTALVATLAAVTSRKRLFWRA